MKTASILLAAAALLLSLTAPATQAQTFEVLFSDNAGANPVAGLIQGSDGDFYGTTRQGGISSFGTVFKITAAGVQTVLHSFNGSNGKWPSAELVQGGDGDFYGTTNQGGANDYGTVFKITPGGVHTVLHSFNSTDGRDVENELVQGSDGAFYGTTVQGGANGLGTVFKITSSGSFTLLHSFNGTLGSGPRAGLTQGSDGSFYGTTLQGGDGYGVVFKITSGGTYTHLHSFGSANGSPWAALTQGGDGNFYGTTAKTGGGSVFKITPGGVHDVLHTFTGPNGSQPFGKLVLASDGAFYGTNYQGGANGHGTVYKVTSGGIHTVLHSFNFTDGSNPQAGLALGGDGDFYGTTSGGGASGLGTVFKITSSGTHTLLHSFNNANGSTPSAGLVQGSDGDFYGTTYYGGAGDWGTVFKITASGTHTLLHSFNSTHGRYPRAGLVQGSDGDFYGTTLGGGASDHGTVFKISASGTHTLLHSFNNTNGREPRAGLVRGSDGDFYGTTYYGGANSHGTVFKISASGTHTVLHNFSNPTGAFPVGLVQGSDGDFYGVTWEGGAGGGWGTVFKISASGTHSVLHSFNGSNGRNPNGLAQGSDGDFYGTTASGGSGGYGTVFKISASGTHTLLHSFSNINGNYPYGGLAQGNDGDFYGSTLYGGANGLGTVFKISASGTQSVLHSFDGSQAAYPRGTPVFGTDGHLYGTANLMVVWKMSFGAPEIALSGNGVDIVNGDATPDTADHTDFGGVLAGAGAGSLARTFTITNEGTADLSLTGTPERVEISGSAAFSVSAQPASASVDADGGTQTFEITFNPATPGPHSAVVSIASDDADENPFTFTVAGEGLNPVVPASFASAADVPVTAAGYMAGGRTVDLGLGFAPSAGTDLTVVDNTGLGFIEGEFGNLAQGQVVVLAHGGQSYRFVADYFGGTGNDLVLRWGIQRLVGWGANPEGQIGDGSLIHRTVPMPAGNTGALAGKFILSLASGNSHSLAVCSDGTVAAWGDNNQGQLGNGTTTRSSTPVAVDLGGALAGKRVVAVSAGIGNSLALCSDGTVYAWGVLKGQASGQTNATSTTPVAVDMSGALAGKTVVAIAAGGYHNLVLCSDGSLFTWGSSFLGVLGNVSIASQTSVAVPVQDPNSVFTGRAPVSISAGVSHNLVLCDDGALAAWGGNELTGAVGDGSNLNRYVPVLVDMSGALAGKTVVQALAGGHSSLAVCADGTLAAWGSGQNYPGNGTQSSVFSPVALNSFGALAGGAVVGAARGSLNGVALLEDGTLAAWGNNQFGGLGIGTTTPETSLLPVAASRVSLAAGEVFGRLVCGGGAQHAFVLGGAGGYVDAPGQVAFDTDSVEVFPGAGHAFVTLTRTGGATATSVTLSTSDGSAGAVPPFAAAVAGTDYEALSTVVDFAEGETSKVVPVALIPRTGRLPNRRFDVSLSAPTGGAALGTLSSAEVRLLAPDTKAPTLTVKFPTAKATLVTQVAPIRVHGTAGDALGLDRVEVEYGGNIFIATLGTATKPTSVPWSFELTPTGDGPVSLTLRAYDLSGNVTTLTRGFDFIRRYPVQVTRQVPAGLSPPELAGTVKLSSSKGDFSALMPTKGALTQTGAVVPLALVTLTPKAAAGYAFSHWEGLPTGASTKGAVASFQMPSEDVTGITAVFVDNPFLGLGAKPVLYGLIYPFDDMTHNNATHGSLTAALTTSSGMMSGKVYLDGQTTSFTGLALGNGSVWFHGPGKVLHAALGLPGGAQMTGGFDHGTFIVEITGSDTLEGAARPAAYSKTDLVPVELLNRASKAGGPVDQGFHTAALPAKAQDPVKPLAEYPQGTGYGSITLKDNGTLRLAGVLADGTKYTAASALVTGDEAPVHAQLLTPGTTTGEKGGSLLGMLAFDPDAPDSDVAGNDLRWFRPSVMEQPGTTAAALATQLYTDGWPEGIVLDLVGAFYDKTTEVETTLGFSAGVLSFSGGKLPAGVEVSNFTLSGSKVTKVPSTDKSFTLSFTQSTGLMKGTFTPGWPSAKLPAFTGVMLGKGANRGGWGYFLSNPTGDTDPESGAVTLEQQP